MRLRSMISNEQGWWMLPGRTKAEDQQEDLTGLEPERIEA